MKIWEVNEKWENKKRGRNSREVNNLPPYVIWSTINMKQFLSILPSFNLLLICIQFSWYSTGDQLLLWVTNLQEIWKINPYLLVEPLIPKKWTLFVILSSIRNPDYWNIESWDMTILKMILVNGEVCTYKHCQRMAFFRVFVSLGKMVHLILQRKQAVFLSVFVSMFSYPQAHGRYKAWNDNYKRFGYPNGNYLCLQLVCSGVGMQWSLQWKLVTLIQVIRSLSQEDLWHGTYRGLHLWNKF